jgi:hypothetical protein
MAEVDVVLGRVSNGTGVFTLTVVVENTQTTPDPRPWATAPSPTVVAVKLVNTSSQPGRCRWQSTNGAWNDNVVLPGENMETRIAPPRREFLYQWFQQASAGWG